MFIHQFLALSSCLVLAVNGFVTPSTSGSNNGVYGIQTTTSSTSTRQYLFGTKSKASPSSSTKPIFDKATEKWTKSPNDDGKYPYDAVGALLRHGPSPFVQRVVNSKGYEQSVLEYMANTGCSRAEATGNMDAKLNNAADWAFQKLEEKKTGKKVDYTVLDPKQAALTAIWALGITPLVVYSVVQTASQFGTGPSVIKH
jgi:hypothetical protein